MGQKHCPLPVLRHIPGISVPGPALFQQVYGKILIQFQEGNHILLMAARHIVDSPADTTDGVFLEGVVKYLGFAYLVIRQVIKGIPVYDTTGTGQTAQPDSLIDIPCIKSPPLHIGMKNRCALHPGLKGPSALFCQLLRVKQRRPAPKSHELFILPA